MIYRHPPKPKMNRAAGLPIPCSNFTNSKSSTARLALLSSMACQRRSSGCGLPATAGALVGLLICWFFTSTPQTHAPHAHVPGRARGRGAVRRG